MEPAANWHFESVDLYKQLCLGQSGLTYEAHSLKIFNKGEFIYHHGDESLHVFFVHAGRVKIYYQNEQGKEVINSILSTGEIFGELALAGEVERNEYAQAMDNNTIVCRWRREDLLALMTENESLNFQVLKLLTLRMHKIQRKFGLVAFKDARSRLIAFLKDAAEWKGKKVGSEVVIMTPLTHQQIAKLVGLSRQLVTTLLNDLRKENQIYFDKKRILIRDINSLR
ncbi:MAG: Crp/Fnr family transcriptional regulator [Cyclobacteriaceae bacterium]